MARSRFNLFNGESFIKLMDVPGKRADLQRPDNFAREAERAMRIAEWISYAGLANRMSSSVRDLPCAKSPGYVASLVGRPRKDSAIVIGHGL